MVEYKQKNIIKYIIKTYNHPTISYPKTNSFKLKALTNSSKTCYKLLFSLAFNYFQTSSIALSIIIQTIFID